MKTVILALGVFALTACGGAAYGTGSSGSTASNAAVVAPSIKVVSDAHMGRILATGSGRTLYRFNLEKDGRVACTGSCASNWIPFLATGGMAPSAAGLPGKLGVVVRPDGHVQITYNEFPLYTFVGDSKGGETKGQGIRAFGGVWAVVPETSPQDADRDADGTARTAATPTPKPAPARVVAPTAPPAAPRAVGPPPSVAPTPTPCNFANPTFNDGDGDNSGNPTDGDGCG